MSRAGVVIRTTWPRSVDVAAAMDHGHSRTQQPRAVEHCERLSDASPADLTVGTDDFTLDQL